MARTIIKNATVILADGLAKDQGVVLQDGKIDRVCPMRELPDERGADVVDAGGDYVAPGFIDVHIHGTRQFLVDNGAEDLDGLCRVLPEFGVTGFLPTVAPLPKGQDAALVSSLASVVSGGTQILGFHLEGPFLSLTGALPVEAIGTNDPDRVRALIEAAEPYPAVFSTSPDFEGILDLIPIMAEGGRPVFITHTAASVEQTQAAIEAGARHATHFYDVFPVPSRGDAGVRPCGAVEAILADPRVTVDFVLDGVHVDPIAVQMALRCKGPEKVCLITDANIGAASPPGRYKFGQEEVQYAYLGAPARFVASERFPEGIAGSGMSLNLAVANAVKFLGIDPALAVRMASTNPAAVLGLDDRKGRIAEGFDADVVLMDESLQIRQTWVGGRSVYSRTS